MNELISQGVIGIVTGIFTTWLILAGKFIWQQKITPYLQATRYQGVKVDGPWIGASNTENEESETRLYLTQKAHELGGSFIFSFKNSEKNFTLDFNVKGYMWEGYLTLPEFIE